MRAIAAPAPGATTSPRPSRRCTTSRAVAPGDDTERLRYGWSVLCRLPAGLSETPSAGTGTVLRASTFRWYATEAGFRDVAVLPIENDFFRFYRLTP